MGTFKKEGLTRAALYSAFLNVKGKTMFDAFIVRPILANQCDDDTEYWVDLNEEDIDPLRKHLHKYALRKNVKIEDISHIIKSFSIQTIVGVKEKEGHFFKRLQDTVEMFESQEFPGVMETDVAAFVDPRTKENGVRLLCNEASFEPEKDVLMMDSPKEQYDAIRMILGLPEGSQELGGQFPLNMNLHMLNAISFSKGCYIGQELT